MATLSELASTMHRALRGELDASEAAGALGVVPERLAVYQRFVAGHVTGVLGKLYPLVRAHLGEALWREVATAYHREVPARSWELNQAGAALPEHLDRWLAERRGGRVEPFHVSLAELEWEQFKVYADPTPVPDPATLDGLTINPTLSVRALAHPVVAWAARHDDVAPTAETPIPEARAGGEVVLVFRRPLTHRVAWFVASDDLRFALTLVAEALTVADAAALSGQPLTAARRALAHAMSLGLVLGPPPAG